MTVGLTGSTGVLGKIAYDLLKEGGYTISCFRGDIKNYVDVSDWLCRHSFKAILHFAALVPAAIVEKEPIRAMETNVVGTLNIVKAIKSSLNNPWFFYASSSHVYKSSPSRISESFPVSPISLYGLTKKMGEDVVLTTSSETKLKCCIGRIFSFWHKTQSREFLYPAMVERFKKEDLKNSFFVRGANNVRDLSKAEDIVAKIILLMQKEAEGIFNIGSGEGITIREFVEKIAPVKLRIVTDEGCAADYLVADTLKFDTEIMGK